MRSSRKATSQEEEEGRPASSTDAARAKNSKIKAPSGKRAKAMRKERWGGDQWMYNWGIRKNTNKVKNPTSGKFSADLAIRSMGPFCGRAPSACKTMVQQMSPWWLFMLGSSCPERASRPSPRTTMMMYHRSTMKSREVKALRREETTMKS